jgi:cell wall-associated NlpC family hydrolase
VSPHNLNPFFKGHGRAVLLECAAKPWIGTPFVAHSQVVGAGVDCVHLCAALYLATGALDKFQPPAYALDGGHHNASSQVTDWLDKHPSFKRMSRPSIDAGALEPGDLLCFRFGKTEHHVGVLLHHGRFVHAPFRRLVEYSSINEGVYRKCLQAVYRPMTSEPLTTDHGQLTD